MQSIDLVVSHKIKKTARVMQVTGMMDYESDITEHHIKIPNVDIDFDWNIGLIVGASGSGKTTIAKNVFKDEFYEAEWGDKALVDEFPKGHTIKEITAALTKVGLGTVPAWLRPYHTLSNGEKFRADIALALMTEQKTICIDEFTSVVDRTVAQIASNSIQKVFRNSDKRLIAVSCHYDIIEWLQPDWIINVQDFTFRRLLRQARPEIEIEIRHVDKQVWEGLKHHHYMNHKLHVAARCFAAYHGDRLVGFTSYLHFPHPKAKNIKMGHRTVVIPDYQGLGLGVMMDNALGEYLKGQKMRYVNNTAHPAMIKSYQNSPLWITKRFGQLPRNRSKSTIIKSSKSRAHRMMLDSRLTASFEYIGEK